MKKALFVATDQNYIKYTNVLLNSIEKYNLDIDVYLIHYGISDEYLDKIRQFSYNIKPIKVEYENYMQLDNISKNMIFKKLRFQHIKDYGSNYDVVALFDADLFIVNKNINNLFELVNNTNKLIGCNERFKWNFNDNYCVDDKPILDRTVRANKFHCSVPIIFDIKKWVDVIDYYNEISFKAIEKDKNKRVGDMYCWNLAVYNKNREDDVILFPMQTMTQVHQTNVRPYSSIKISDGNWQTSDGDEVYTIHGRIGDEWERQELERHNKVIKDLGVESIQVKSKLRNEAMNTLKTIRKEWDSLSTYKVSI